MLILDAERLIDSTQTCSNNDTAIKLVQKSDCDEVILIKILRPDMIRTDINYD